MEADPNQNCPLTPKHRRAIVAMILVSLSANLLFPGEVFYQTKFLLILTSILTFLIVCVGWIKSGNSSGFLRLITIIFLPLLVLVPSLFATINAARSQEVFWLLFSYACLFSTLRLIKLESFMLLLSILIITSVAFFIDLFSLYQYFFGLADLKNLLIRSTTLGESFKSALLTRVASKRVFANFPLPNTLAGFLAMILPLQLFLVYSATRPTSRLISCSSKLLSTFFQSSWVLAFFLVQLCLSLLVLTLTQSFGGWVCSASSATLISILLLTNRKNPPRLMATVTSVLVLIVAGWMALLIYQRGFGLWDVGAFENPIALRWINYKTAIAIFRDFPVFGVGLGNYGSINPLYQSALLNVTQYAHNTPLQLLSECGFLFLGLALLLLFRVARKWRALLSCVLSQDLAYGFLKICLLASSLAWFIHNLIDIDLYFPSLGALGVFLVGLFANSQWVEVREPVTTPILSRSRSNFLAVAFSIGLCMITFLVFKSYLGQTWLSLAINSVEAKDFRQAQKYINKAAAINETDAAMIILQAKIKVLNANQEGQAKYPLLISLRGAYEQATKLDPFNANYHYELSRILVALGEKELALLARTRAKELFPSEPKFSETSKLD